MVRYFVDENGEVFGGLNDKGQEVPDPRPVSVPTGLGRPETLAEQVQRLVRTQMSQQAADSGEETFEEADDFDVGDDFDPRTPFEMHFDPNLGFEVSDQMRISNNDRYRSLIQEQVRSQNPEPNSAPITPREAEGSSSGTDEGSDD